MSVAAERGATGVLGEAMEVWGSARFQSLFNGFRWKFAQVSSHAAPLDGDSEREAFGSVAGVSAHENQIAARKKYDFRRHTLPSRNS